MEEQLKRIAEDVQETYGLVDYYLQSSEIHRRHNAHQETLYVISMDFFPKKYRDTEVPDDENPEGTAVIEIDFHTKQLYRLVFVHDVSHAKQSSAYPDHDKEAVIDWLEDQTGLIWGRQFSLMNVTDDSYTFRATVDNIPVYPAGMMEVGFSGNKLTRFYIDGSFPKNDQVVWEPFALVPENVTAISQKQVKLVNFPVDHQKKWIQAYGLDEIFISNHGQVIPLETRENAGPSITLHVSLEWSEKASGQFDRQDMEFNDVVSLEEAMNNKQDPDTKPITSAEQESCIQTVIHFLQSEFPNDSGEWVLTSLRREHGFFIADLKETKMGLQRIMSERIHVFIHPDTMQAVNYIDKKALLDVFSSYKKTDKATITKEAAFEKIRGHITLEPTYVLDKFRKAYVMCGLLDCEYGVDAVTGKKMLLADFED